MTGFSWALALALQHVHSLDSVEILYDSMFAARNADATWSDGGCGILPNTVSSLYSMLSAATNVTLSHERAHQGAPYNELVDSLCTWYTKETADGVIFDAAHDNLLSQFAANVTDAQWAFIACLPPAKQAQFP